ncbi:MAG: Gfo/Idh/MocA family protein [Chloroflexota bacterium]
MAEHMAGRYRVGLIACGIIAQAHLRAYRKIPAVEVVAGADLSAEVRERWSAEHGIPTMYASAEEMLERERPDVVSICTWPPLRPEMTELACAHGVQGILAEKPMAVDLAGCDRMIAAAERSGTVLIIGTQRRFHNRYIKARELIDAGAIGDIAQISVFIGGDLLTSATHMVDVIRYLLHDAPAEWVIGQIDRRDPGFTNRRLGLQRWEETHMRYGHHIETGALGLIQFQGGARGLVECGIVSRPRPGYSAIIYGTNGMIEASGDQPAEGEPWLRARVKGQAGWITPPIEGNDAFQAEIEALIDVLERGGTHPLNGRSARQGHEILMAIYESARRRARIDLPLDAAESPLEAMVAAGEA